MLQSKELKLGFTTGTAATAASLACLRLLLALPQTKTIRTPLPPFKSRKTKRYLDVPIEESHLLSPTCAQAQVRKDGGSDPDVTHGALIEVHLTLNKESKDPLNPISIEGGVGVGKVTLPGLPLPPGSWAINPVPQAQIRYALQTLWENSTSKPLPSLSVKISVPQGEAIAKKTFNPRLGILGGISILGTHGTVVPYSHAAFKATLNQQLKLALSLNCKTLYLSTGRRSERLLQKLYPHNPSYAFIQAGDWVAYALKNAHNLGFKKLIWGCFWGKLLKLAAGHPCTHAHISTLDFKDLTRLSLELGCQCFHELSQVTTAYESLTFLLKDPQGSKVIQYFKNQAQKVASDFAKQDVQIHLFHLDGFEL
ncbi:MAG: cobalt-precorrin-5B (C(1))-methyltransferase [Desulfovibrionaceae bacterium]|nr:cobalt-precorrin-5B (C(1))-methyltransferase [Desulfovibrionaceae bacterium]